MTRVAWVLNFDADHELREGRGYTPGRAMAARLATLPARLPALVRPGDAVLAPGASYAGWEGRAWCPTPSALARLAAAGIAPPAAPALEVLRAVNHRRFCSDLGQVLAGAAFTHDAGEVARLSRAPTPSGHWLLKRPFSTAGSGQRRVAVGVLDAADRAWVDASLARDGLQVEPWVDRAGEYALHGFVAGDGTATFGAICRQELDAHGQWQASARLLPHALEPAEEQALGRAGERVAAALAARGYFGPFGLDAYRYRDEAGLAFHPLSEINARYTMGWAIGMGDRRPDV